MLTQCNPILTSTRASLFPCKRESTPFACGKSIRWVGGVVSGVGSVGSGVWSGVGSGVGSVGSGVGCGGVGSGV